MTVKQLAARDRAMAAEMAAEFLEDVMPELCRREKRNEKSPAEDGRRIREEKRSIREFVWTAFERKA